MRKHRRQTLLASTRIILKSIECTKTGESGKGGDDLRIEYFDERGPTERYPEDGSTGYGDIEINETWDLNIPIDFGDYVTITLYDNDKDVVGDGNDDYLGHHTYYPSDATDDMDVSITSTHKGRYIFHTGPAPE